MKRLAAGFIALSLALGASGCASNDNLANQFKQGDNKNYIAGDGTVTEFAKANRVAPAAWSGTTESGATLSSADLLGKVVVLNFWYAGCAPCRAETPDLAAIGRKYANDGLVVVGVNVRDTAATALAFDRTHDIDYPSVMDAASGSVILAFNGIVTPQAVPTTLVIGRDGKVTASVLGRFDRGILETLIKTAISE
jgi:thiol-disulfide isomerase/thioredoxin